MARAAQVIVALALGALMGFVLRGLLSRLCERLRVRGLACGSLDLGLHLASGWDGGGHDARRIGMAAPTRDIRVLLRLVCLDLEQHPPRAPIEAVSLLAPGRGLRGARLDDLHRREGSANGGWAVAATPDAHHHRTPEQHLLGAVDCAGLDHAITCTHQAQHVGRINVAGNADQQ